MKFAKEFLIDQEGLTVYDKVVDVSRWSIHYERVFEFEGKFYKTTYSRGATESQWEVPYEDDGDEVECPEVFPHQTTITVYLPYVEGVGVEV